ncbi:hypothetical protein DFS34DRAFT_433601 [Phlyctochytrium arcticum]|nr:hypothetical protein DFS34DRAFT_433601 [Phlyctochytrium arcticum]
MPANRKQAPMPTRLIRGMRGISFSFHLKFHGGAKNKTGDGKADGKDDKQKSVGSSLLLDKPVTGQGPSSLTAAGSSSARVTKPSTSTLQQQEPAEALSPIAKRKRALSSSDADRLKNSGAGYDLMVHVHDVSSPSLARLINWPATATAGGGGGGSSEGGIHSRSFSSPVDRLKMLNHQKSSPSRASSSIAASKAGSLSPPKPRHLTNFDAHPGSYSTLQASAGAMSASSKQDAFHFDQQTGRPRRLPYQDDIRFSRTPTPSVFSTLPSSPDRPRRRKRTQSSLAAMEQAGQTNKNGWATDRDRETQDQLHTLQDSYRASLAVPAVREAYRTHRRRHSSHEQGVAGFDVPSHHQQQQQQQQQLPSLRQREVDHRRAVDVGSKRAYGPSSNPSAPYMRTPHPHSNEHRDAASLTAAAILAQGINMNPSSNSPPRRRVSTGAVPYHDANTTTTKRSSPGGAKPQRYSPYPNPSAPVSRYARAAPAFGVYPTPHATRSTPHSRISTSPSLLSGGGHPLSVPLTPTSSSNNDRILVKIERRKQQVADRERKIKQSTSAPGKCRMCATCKTGQWRKGPEGPRTLCNACGLDWSKRVKSEARRKGVSVNEAESVMAAAWIALHREAGGIVNTSANKTGPPVGTSASPSVGSTRAGSVSVSPKRKPAPSSSSSSSAWPAVAPTSTTTTTTSPKKPHTPSTKPSPHHLRAPTTITSSSHRPRPYKYHSEDDIDVDDSSDGSSSGSNSSDSESDDDTPDEDDRTTTTNTNVTTTPALTPKIHRPTTTTQLPPPSSFHHPVSPLQLPHSSIPYPSVIYTNPYPHHQTSHESPSKSTPPHLTSPPESATSPVVKALAPPVNPMGGTVSF